MKRRFTDDSPSQLNFDFRFFFLFWWNDNRNTNDHCMYTSENKVILTFNLFRVYIGSLAFHTTM